MLHTQAADQVTIACMHFSHKAIEVWLVSCWELDCLMFGLHGPLINLSQVLPTTTPVLCLCNRCLTPQLQALAAGDHNTSHGRCIPPVCVLTCLVDAGLDAAAGKLVF